jgi:hydroxymethylpyrimidine/phosphomethylpyrimidine kinase
VRPRVLAVAAHPPTGGAGVLADRETCLRFGVEAQPIVTAWTEQDGERVHAVTALAVEGWLAQARPYLAHPLAALKSGLLPSAAAVRGLATRVAELAPGVPAVVDPVLAASGGEPFLDDEGIEALLAELLPRGVILTPNLVEAARLAGLELAELQRDPAARIRAGEALLERGARAVVVKGGHASDTSATDLLVERDAPPRTFVRPRLPGARLHGSGCRFASALAAHLALGHPLAAATAAAGEHVAELLRAPARR